MFCLLKCSKHPKQHLFVSIFVKAFVESRMTCLRGTVPGTGAKAVIKTNRDSLAEIFGQIISKTKQKTTQGSKPVREQQAVMSTNYKDNKKVV